MEPASTANRPSLRERNRERTRQALLAAAERRFTTAGYHDTTVEQIADDADVSVSSLYNYFGSKLALYLASVEQAVEANRRYMDAAYDERWSPTEQVMAAAEAYLRFHLEHPGYFQMVALPQLSSRPGDAEQEVAERIAARVEHEVGRLIEVIAAGVRSGELRDVDPDRAATFLWGAWNGVIALGTRPDRLRRDDAEIAAVLDTGRRIVLEGLAR